MQKLLIYWVCGASILISGCSTINEIGSAVPRALDKMPLIPRPDIQQGNVITQDTINKLRPGMTKNQARYIMGTPMLVDVFHQDRWDYIYSMQSGGEERKQERISLFFSDDRLVRIEGDYRPLAATEDPLKVDKDAVISVPDYTGTKGIFSRVLEKAGIESDK